MSDVMIVGIAGGTGSGKTTITQRIVREFGDNVAVLYHDNYYKAHHSMTYEQRAALNYDHPDAFDTELLIRDLRAIRQGKSICCINFPLQHQQKRYRRPIFSRS